MKRNIKIWLIIGILLMSILYTTVSTLAYSPVFYEEKGVKGEVLEIKESYGDILLKIKIINNPDFEPFEEVSDGDIIWFNLAYDEDVPEKGDFVKFDVSYYVNREGDWYLSIENVEKIYNPYFFNNINCLIGLVIVLLFLAIIIDRKKKIFKNRKLKIICIFLILMLFTYILSSTIYFSFFKEPGRTLNESENNIIDDTIDLGILDFSDYKYFYWGPLMDENGTILGNATIIFKVNNENFTFFSDLYGLVNITFPHSIEYDIYQIEIIKNSFRIIREIKFGVKISK